MNLLPVLVRGGRGDGDAPRQGCVFHSPGVEARSAEDPRLRMTSDIDATPIGCRSLSRSLLRATPGGVEGLRAMISRGLRGFAPPTPGL